MTSRLRLFHCYCGIELFWDSSPELGVHLDEACDTAELVASYHVATRHSRPVVHRATA